MKIIENNWNRYKKYISNRLLTKDIFLKELKYNLLDKNTREFLIKKDINFIIEKINKKRETFLEVTKKKLNIMR